MSVTDYRVRLDLTAADDGLPCITIGDGPLLTVAEAYELGTYLRLVADGVAQLTSTDDEAAS